MREGGAVQGHLLSKDFLGFRNDCIAVHSEGAGANVLEGDIVLNSRIVVGDAVQLVLHISFTVMTPCEW